MPSSRIFSANASSGIPRTRCQASRTAEPVGKRVGAGRVVVDVNLERVAVVRFQDRLHEPRNRVPRPVRRHVPDSQFPVRRAVIRVVVPRVTQRRRVPLVPPAVLREHLLRRNPGVAVRYMHKLECIPGSSGAPATAPRSIGTARSISPRRARSVAKFATRGRDRGRSRGHARSARLRRSCCGLRSESNASRFSTAGSSGADCAARWAAPPPLRFRPDAPRRPPGQCRVAADSSRSSTSRKRVAASVNRPDARGRRRDSRGRPARPGGATTFAYASAAAGQRSWAARMLASRYRTSGSSGAMRQTVPAGLCRFVEPPGAGERGGEHDVGRVRIAGSVGPFPRRRRSPPRDGPA